MKKRAKQQITYTDCNGQQHIIVVPYSTAQIIFQIFVDLNKGIRMTDAG